MMDRGSKVLVLGALVTAVGLALACGGGGGDNSMMRGTIDMTVPGAAKGLPQAPGDNAATITFTNIVTGAEKVVTTDDGTFAVLLEHGSYDIVARNAAGRTVRRIVPAFSGSTNVGAVDASSTAVAVLVFAGFVQADDAVNDLADVGNLAQIVAALEDTLEAAEAVLLGQTVGSEGAALLALGAYQAVAEAMAQNADLSDETADAFVDIAEVEEAFDEAVLDLLENNPGETVTVGERTFDDANDVPEDMSTVVDSGDAFEDVGEEAAGGGGGDGETTQLAVLAVRSGDWASGAVSTVTTTGTRTAVNNLLPADTSDLDITSYNGSIYIIRKYMADNVIKVDGGNVAAAGVVYQYSTMSAAEENTSNPQWMAFVGDTKAYLSRYEYNTLWIVDPSAATEDAFKTGEIDLSDFADGDESAEISRMTVVGTRLFVCLQRMDRTDPMSWVPSNTAYVVVIDTETHEVIDVDPDHEGIQAIELATRNPQKIEHLPQTGLIYVQSVGRYPGFGNDAEYTGGIETIDPVSYRTRLLVDDDDGAGTAAYGGNISNMALASATKGYLVTYAAWGDTSVRSFDPTTGAVGDVVTGLANIDCAGLGVDDHGYLWVLDQGFAAPGVRVFDTTTDTQVGDLIDLGGLNPIAITFVDIPQ
jgi:hypothetical protein